MQHSKFVDASIEQFFVGERDGHPNGVKQMRTECLHLQIGGDEIAWVEIGHK